MINGLFFKLLKGTLFGFWKIQLKLKFTISYLFACCVIGCNAFVHGINFLILNT